MSNDGQLPGPRLDRFRDPFGWAVDALPWRLRRFYVAWQFKVKPSEVPANARYVGFRKPDWATFERGRELAEKHGW